MHGRSREKQGSLSLPDETGQPEATRPILAFQVICLPSYRKGSRMEKNKTKQTHTGDRPSDHRYYIKLTLTLSPPNTPIGKAVPIRVFSLTASTFLSSIFSGQAPARGEEGKAERKVTVNSPPGESSGLPHRVPLKMHHLMSSRASPFLGAQRREKPEEQMFSIL